MTTASLERAILRAARQRLAAQDAAAAQPPWARSSGQQCADILGRPCREMSARQLARVLTPEGGEPLSASLAEIARAAEHVGVFPREAFREPEHGRMNAGANGAAKPPHVEFADVSKVAYP